jgi:hypothetical protein
MRNTLTNPKLDTKKLTTVVDRLIELLAEGNDIDEATKVSLECITEDLVDVISQAQLLRNDDELNEALSFEEIKEIHMMKRIMEDLMNDKIGQA